ncbi:hypothetical protein IVB03_13930 [Bradyrhizobium sp. 168]|uniref:hypothetical protein n=1 Tax=Bradyrhizobium sp. 168 TaxID=2782639 RepID=UPI001FF7BF2C|nr:hypothetical protein [Bradyrhizobium sp. 168]MCK1580650.1 hypothetical protein [Bradyrhizobium sp. 168]
MPHLDELLNGLESSLVLTFFATFARLEFAMKYAGYLKRVENAPVAEASTTTLARRLGPAFFEKLRVNDDAKMLIEDPPKNLFVQADRSLRFGPAASPLNSTQELLNAVWRVRNNLFHGNKTNPGDRERDTALITAALAVIQAVLESDSALAAAFDEPQQFF